MSGSSLVVFLQGCLVLAKRSYNTQSLSFWQFQDGDLGIASLFYNKPSLGVVKVCIDTCLKLNRA